MSTTFTTKLSPRAAAIAGGKVASTPATSTPSGPPAFAPDTPFGAGAEKTDHFLQRIKLFSALSSQDCQEIVKRMKRRDFPPNYVVVREGSPGNSMFVITTGQVQVRKIDASTGIEFMIAEIGPGQNFGEMSLLTGKPRTATVTTVHATTCAVLEQPDFQNLLLQFPKMGLALTTILADRVEEATRQKGIDFINLSKMKIDPRVLELIPQAMIAQHKILPVSFCNNRLTLAMTNPNNILALDDVRRVVKGVMIEPVVVTEDDFRKFMNTTYLELTKKDEPEAQAGGESLP